MYDVILTTKSTLITTELIPWCANDPAPIHYSHSCIHTPGGSVSPVFPLTSCTPAKSNLYFANSLVAFISERAV
jgi:hypothetical protein